MATLPTKIRDVYSSQRWRELKDPRFLGITLLAVIGLSVLWNGARVVQQNYLLLQRIAIIEEENRILTLENGNKQIQNDYFKSPEYAELKARRVNGKAASGERVFIVTNETAEKALKTPEQTELLNLGESSKPTYQQNFEDWIDFFFNN